MFLDKLAQAAITNCGLSKDTPILLGVSGGVDSLAMMDGLDVLGYNLIIAHLDHAIRPDSSQDADFIDSLAGTCHLPFVRKRVDVQAIAKEEGLSLEEAARVVRYQFLFEQAEQHGAQAVAVAHHADDQVETILMHFIRGAALDGLSGMPYRRLMPQWSQEIPLVRPLLGIWREEIEAYLLKTGLSPRIDMTNQDRTYFRNRLRHELIPELETLNPQFCEVVWRTAEVLGEENQFLSKLADSAWSDCFISQTQDHVSLDRMAFNGLPKALQRRVFRRTISQLRPGLRDIGFDAIERGIKSIAGSDMRGEMDLTAKLNLAVLDDVVIVKTWGSELPDGGKPLIPSVGFETSIDVGDVVGLQNGWCLKAEMLDVLPEKLANTVKTLSDNEAWLDFESLVLPLTLRSRKPGDRWQPLGMVGHTQKLHDFFINEKIPAYLRDTWPLIVSGEDIAWVVGLRPSEAFKVTNETRHILHLFLFQHKD